MKSAGNMLKAFVNVASVKLSNKYAKGPNIIIIIIRKTLTLADMSINIAFFSYIYGKIHTR